MSTSTTTDISPELVTGFDLYNPGTEEKPVYQFIYASQLYCTLFAIYGRFQTTMDGDNYVLHGVDLKLLNYQGVINVGFTPDETYSPPFYEKLKEDEAKVYFGVIGMSELRDKVVPFDPPLTVEKGKRCTITFCRILYALPGFDCH